MKDSAQKSLESIQSFKNEMFIWEILITAMVFVAVFYFMRSYKAKEQKSQEDNKQYETFD
jgi:heme/copper-type cytochrome/quinol oxidase subunit 2